MKKDLAREDEMAPISVSSRPRALITGASSGIGMAFAARLARAAHDLVLVARRRDRLHGLAEQLGRDTGVLADVVCADLTEPDSLAKLEDLVSGDHRLALLVNNAGFGGYRPFASIDPKVIDNLIDVHVRAVARLTRAALPGMIERGNGGVINISSVVALSGTLPPNPLPHRATYAGAKAFMLAFTQTLAGELNGTGVRVQVCLPGRVRTEFHTSQGIDITKLPPMMTADDLVTASLSGLAQGEIVCVPALTDATLMNRISEAQIAVLQAAAFQPAIAERYRSPTPA
jgi:uncharacterized protein